jgi:hypothetical protein
MPSSRTITFSGFTSRWTTPAAWAAARAAAMSMSQRSRAARESEASPTKRRSGVPGTYSIAM